MTINYKTIIDTIIDDVIQHRRWLHQHPELSGEEWSTQTYIQDVLAKQGIPYVSTATTGVIASICADQPGRNIALRADIDALPITEENDVSYKSIETGIMHACGHDVHTAIQLGVAMALQRVSLPFGSVKFIFQPDEEQRGAAKIIVREGHLDDVDVVLGLHVMPHIEVGNIEVRDGALNARSGNVIIDVHGVTAHGAYPELGVDAIVVASHLLVQLQSMITRLQSPLEPMVLTFGIIQGGVRPNIIADNVRLVGTLRTIHDDTRTKLQGQIERLCHHTAQAMGATTTVEFTSGYPALINDPAINKHIVQNATCVEDVTAILYKPTPSMGAEDFGYYLQQAIGAFFHLGCGNQGKGITSGLHTPTFDVDERCIRIGIELQLRNILSLLEVT